MSMSMLIARVWRHFVAAREPSSRLVLLSKASTDHGASAGIIRGETIDTKIWLVTWQSGPAGTTDQSVSRYVPYS